VQSPGVINVMIVPHIAGCKNSVRHIENRFSPYFRFFRFKNAVWAFTSGGFRIVSDTLVSSGIGLRLPDWSCCGACFDTRFIFFTDIH